MEFLLTRIFQRNRDHIREYFSIGKRGQDYTTKYGTITVNKPRTNPTVGIQRTNPRYNLEYCIGSPCPRYSRVYLKLVQKMLSLQIS